MSRIDVIEGCEDFTLGDGRTGALVLHGFTSSPQVVRPLGERLADAGLRVVGPRLPGHGTTWQDCNRYGHADWAEAVGTAFEKLRAETEHTFVVGFSFGAALALDLAARKGDEVAGIVAIAPFLFTKDPRRFLAPAMAIATRSIPGVGNDIAHPTNREVVYERFPSRSGYKMMRFARRAKSALPRVSQPILIMHSRTDNTAPPDNSRYIHDNVSSRDKELVWYDRSRHVLPLDNDADDVAERTIDFIQQRARSAV